MSRQRDEFDEIGKKLKTDQIDGNCNNSNSNMGRRPLTTIGPNYTMNPLGGSGGGGSLNTITPCAACKLLRRRCAEECPFSPYFSPHEPHKFAAVHKVFGASNVSKLLMDVPEHQRADAANSLVYEANVRLRDPIYGCMGAISALQHQVQALQAELNTVRAEILRYKYREAANSIMNVAVASSQVATFAVSVADLAQAPPPPTPPPPPPLPPSAAAASTDPSLYNSNSSNASYGSISNNSHSIPYFD